MLDRYNHDFHLTRETQERMAAENAVSDLTRALHLKLAELHHDCVRSVKGEQALGDSAHTATRPTVFFGAQIAVRSTNLTLHA